MTQLDLLTEPRAPQRTHRPMTRSEGYPVIDGLGAKYTTWHPYNPAMFAAIRRELADGPRTWGDLYMTLRAYPGDTDKLKGHLYRMVSTGEVEEGEVFYGAENPRDPGYQGSANDYRLTEAA